jgi:hypothetical protein
MSSFFGRWVEVVEARDEAKRAMWEMSRQLIKGCFGGWRLLTRSNQN